MAHENVQGWGIDRRIEDRPGYPLEQRHRLDHDPVAGQSPRVESIPLRGLSGILRRYAYAIPDWKLRHWMTLMLADRIDVLEAKMTPRKLALAGGIAGLLSASLLRRRAR